MQLDKEKISLIQKALADLKLLGDYVEGKIDDATRWAYESFLRGKSDVHPNLVREFPNNEASIHPQLFSDAKATKPQDVQKPAEVTTPPKEDEKPVEPTTAKPAEVTTPPKEEDEQPKVTLDVTHPED